MVSPVLKYDLSSTFEKLLSRNILTSELAVLFSEIGHVNCNAFTLLPKAYFWIKHQYTIDIKQQHPISPMSY
jgi:hypothetical protein